MICSNSGSLLLQDHPEALVGTTGQMCPNFAIVRHVRDEKTQ